LLIRINYVRIVTFEWAQSFNQDRIILLNILMISLIYSCSFRVPCILRLKAFRSLFLLHRQMGLLLFGYWFIIISAFLIIHVKLHCIFMRMELIIVFFVYYTIHVIQLCNWCLRIWVWRGDWTLIVYLQRLQLRYHYRWLTTL
jgi:hypothetical protein